MNIAKITKAWAAATDSRIQTTEGKQSCMVEMYDQTKVLLEIDDPVTGNTPFLEMWIPHARRNPLYFYGPDEEDESDYMLPSFKNERELRCALDIVYRRFMTDHGMMRFDDDPWAVHGLKAPKIAGIIRRWAKKNRDLARVQESVLEPTGATEFLIQPVCDEVDQYFKIHTQHNIRQSVWHDSDGCQIARQTFPPFITGPELDDLLETIIRMFNPENSFRANP